MCATATVALSKEDVHAEIEDLTHQLLPMLLTAVHVLAWVWLGHLLTQEWELWPHAAPSFVVMMATWVAHLLRKRHFRAACWLFLSSVILASGLIVPLRPGWIAPAFGTLAVIVAHALLGEGESLAACLLTWSAAVVGQRLYPGFAVQSWDSLTVLVLYLLTWAVVWLVRRPQATAVEWALTGWARAHDALNQVRKRRGELYRMVRALEEATYRIERMNNELFLARGEAEAARAQKARFAATVSHELGGPRNPLHQTRPDHGAHVS